MVGKEALLSGVFWLKKLLENLDQAFAGFIVLFRIKLEHRTRAVPRAGTRRPVAAVFSSSLSQ